MFPLQAESVPLCFVVCCVFRSVMNILRSILSLPLFVSLVVPCTVYAELPNHSSAVNPKAVASDDVKTFSSSSIAELPDVPAPVVSRKKDRSGMNILYQTYMRPFSHIAMAVKLGAEGIGLDLATPLSNKWNLRGGVSLLTGDYNFKVSGVGELSSDLQPLKDGINIEAKPRFSTVSASLDWFPRYGSFRISPGLTFYNGNHGTALATVQGGQVINIGDEDYTSDPRNPLLATIDVRFGRTVAPRLTIGWGNMLPRAGEHFSFPFEVGFQYAGKPLLLLALSGKHCDMHGDCGPIANDPTAQSNLALEQK